MSRIDPTAKLPPYRQLAEIIAGQIRSGTLRKGERIASESELIEEYEVSRSTVRRTVAYLRDQGLVETVPTRGTYVL
ncbi:MAG TPA: winged helix-turn-helix domain-containing protein [Gemmataceae bacterium]|nr:winged helix-turn-helix domain-containing protein [Gemmataceae bacterium]